MTALAGLEPARLAVLAGAGVSAAPPSLLPTATRFLDTLFDVCLPASVDRNSFRPWRAHALAEPQGGLRFEAVVDLVQRRFDPELKLLTLYGHAQPNENHYLLSELARRGALLLTTNFDTLIERAITPVLPARTSTDDFARLARDVSATEPAIWHLHGALDEPTTGQERRHSIIASVSGCWISKGLFEVGAVKHAALAEILRVRDLLVVGYSGSDDFDICPALEQITSARRVVWVDHGSAENPADMIDLLTLDMLPDGFCWYRHAGRNVLAAMLSVRSRAAGQVTLLRGDTTEVLKTLVVPGAASVRGGAQHDDRLTSFMQTWQQSHVPTELDRALFAILALRAANQNMAARKLFASLGSQLHHPDTQSLRAAIELLSMTADQLFAGIDLGSPVSAPPDFDPLAPSDVGDPGLRAAMLLATGRTLERRGFPVLAAGLIEESLRLRREIGLALDLDAVLHAKAHALFTAGYSGGKLELAYLAATEARAEAQRVNNPEGIACCELLLGRIYERIGEVDKATRHYQSAVSAARASCLERLVGLTSGEYGLCLWIEGARAGHVRAAELLADAFRVHFLERNPRSLVIVSSNLALCLESLGQFARSLYADCIAYQCARMLSDHRGVKGAFRRVRSGSGRERLPPWRWWRSRDRYVARIIDALQDRGVRM